MPQIIITRGPFKGELSLTCNDVEVVLPTDLSQPFEVPVGNCRLDSGPRVGNSGIMFDVDQSNHISNVLPAESATVFGNMLTLVLIDFEICASNYVGSYRTSLNGASHIDASQNHHFKTKAIVGLEFFIGNLAAVGGSVFYTKSDAAGNIETSNPEAAKCFEGGVAFNTTGVKMTAVNENLKISGEIQVTAPGEYFVIKNLTTHLVTEKQSVFYFVP